MKKLLFGAIALFLSACASVPALANECEMSWSRVEAQLRDENAQIVALDAAQVAYIGRVYNEAEPVTDFQFTAGFFVELPGVGSGAALLVGECAIAFIPITRGQLEALIPGV